MADIVHELGFQSAFLLGNAGLFDGLCIFAFPAYLQVNISKCKGKFLQILIQVLSVADKHDIHPSVFPVRHAETKAFLMTSAAFQDAHDVFFF